MVLFIPPSVWPYLYIFGLVQLVGLVNMSSWKKKKKKRSKRNKMAVRNWEQRQKPGTIFIFIFAFQLALFFQGPR